MSIIITEVYGPPGAGKTTYALNMIKENQISLYINADRQLFENYLKKDMFVVNSNNVDKLLEIITILIEDIDVIILDSLPSLNHSNDMDNDTNKIISKVQKMISLCNRYKKDMIIVNQRRYSSKVKNTTNTYGLRRLILYYNKRIEVKE